MNRKSPARRAAPEFELSYAEHWHLYTRAAAVGLLVGLVSVAFRATLTWLDQVRESLVASLHTFDAPYLIVAPIAACGLLAAVAVWLVRRFAPEAAGSGIPQVEGILENHGAAIRPRVLPVKFLSGLMAIGGGLALGREGPTVQMGATLGSLVESGATGTRDRREAMIAAGAGAGLAAAFNAPLAGLIFVCEELRAGFSPRVFKSAFIACVIADIITRYALGALPEFRVTIAQMPPLGALPLFALLGLAAGVLGVLFNALLLGLLDRLDQGSLARRVAIAAVIGGGVGALAWFAPDLVGGGEALAQEALQGNVALRALPIYFLVRFGLSLVSYGAGTAGGIFAPLLVLGALLGLMLGWGGQTWIGGEDVHLAAFAVVGMAAYFTAVVRAPVTGLLLILEMTGGFTLMLPLLVACFVADWVAYLLGGQPIYTALRLRDEAQRSAAAITS